MLLQIIILGYILPTAICYYLLLIDSRILTIINQLVIWHFEKDNLRKISFFPVLNIGLSIIAIYLFFKIEK
jgi:hypothetical protein